MDVRPGETGFRMDGFAPYGWAFVVDDSRREGSDKTNKTICCRGPGEEYFAGRFAARFDAAWLHWVHWSPTNVRQSNDGATDSIGFDPGQAADESAG
jgi:hypothetical protein